MKDGVLYCYENGNWSTADRSEQIKQLLPNDLLLCTVDIDGEIAVDDIDQIGRPLTSAYYYCMAQKLIELNKSTPFVKLSGDIMFGARALATDGTVLLPVVDRYECFTMEEKPCELSDEFVLTEKGNVYCLRVVNFDQPYLRCIYDGGDITLISAAYGTGQCLGITDDGTVLSWNESGHKNFDIPFVSNWKNVDTVKQGFHFAVGLTKKGEVLYADSNEENTRQIGRQFKKWGKVTAIAIDGMTVYGLKSDGSCLSMKISL